MNGTLHLLMFGSRFANSDVLLTYSETESDVDTCKSNLETIYKDALKDTSLYSFYKVSIPFADDIKTMKENLTKSASHVHHTYTFDKYGNSTSTSDTKNFSPPSIPDPGVKFNVSDNKDATIVVDFSSRNQNYLYLDDKYNPDNLRGTDSEYAKHLRDMFAKENLFK